MKCQIWTRIVVTSLLLLGDSAFASEINHRSDAEAAASGNTVQVSQPEYLDDIDSEWQPSFTGANSIHTNVSLRYQTLVPVDPSFTYTSIYKLYNPRAPPLVYK